ncbi:hypothetical protein BJ138DRAFT_1134002 [Hygrophoropsis aurantiaca]|uniref:Uncharacterized protein n=1 Tax=Hygrophoropsis aurantiaca TaxID=72124 RepID=A0ACB8AL70_9AGAM|nr:hypothetical protein BJ138DRAFT_1134002 [Hygrophoropsis aurantiaca]
MASSSTEPPTPRPTQYGVHYPPSLLDSLPCVSSVNSKPVHLLPVDTFSSLHLAHLVSHPPDSVLFPFMHGLEGSNEPQNHFFSSPQTQSPGGMVQDHTGRAVRPPRYRGLVWVLCDDDVPNASVPSSDSDDDDEEEDDYDESDGDDVHAVAMAVDTESMDVDEPAHKPHMHPVAQRALKITTTSNNINNNTHHAHDRRSSNASTTSSTSLASTNTSSSSDSTAATSYLPSPTSPSYQASSCPPSPIAPQSDTHQQQLQQDPDETVLPPILTSTFLPSALLRNAPTAEDFFGQIQTGIISLFTSRSSKFRTFKSFASGCCSHDEFEFRPPKVPDGISLRNFGIQVPIYATISDIVVYSPHGASPSAIKLAERFACAIKRARGERKSRWEAYIKTGAAQDSIADSDAHDYEDADADLIDYNVFVLDADAQAIERDLPHMVMRKEDAVRGAHTESTDGRVVGDVGHTLDVDVDGSRCTVLYSASASPSASQSKSTLTSVPTDSLLHRANTIDFAQREKEEMRDLTRASEIISVFPSDWNTSGVGVNAGRDSRVGQVFLGNVNDVPVAPVPRSKSGPKTKSNTAPNGTTEENQKEEDPFAYLSTNPAGYDICIECHEGAPIPSGTHLRAVEEHIRALDGMWADRCRAAADIDLENGLCDPSHSPGLYNKARPRPRPPPHADAVVHLPFPSTPSTASGALNSLMAFIKFLERMVSDGGSSIGSVGGGRARSVTSASPSPAYTFRSNQNALSKENGAVSSDMSSNGSFHTPMSSPIPVRIPSSSSFSSTTLSRPLKILLHSTDGYTESSVAALCLLMAIKGITLPEAYLELQVVKRRSFFVYQNEVGVLKKIETRLDVCKNGSYGYGSGHGHEQTTAAVPPTVVLSHNSFMHSPNGADISAPTHAPSHSATYPLTTAPTPASTSAHRPLILSSSVPSVSVSSVMATPPVSFMSASTSTLTSTSTSVPHPPLRRPRASTMPTFISDHQTWFNDARFDGSFPSRVLPFLYLGNLNHASNAYMLHALGITHVVSVGECALVPPPQNSKTSIGATTTNLCSTRPSPAAHFVAGKGPGGQGSLWIEEREGRIKVLDIKGVCDDGIDTLEHQLSPICSWIEKARLEGGQILVHCRVGVSRSATVTIAYVMQHLGLSLVDAYLVVRSRRLSVLIQPNMRLLYNLLGWEVKLAKERSGGDETHLRGELSKALSWPYLASQVHSLNEKYLT